MFGGKEAGAPEPIVEGLAIGASGAPGNHGDEVGEVFIFGAKSVGKPGAHGRATRDLGAGLEEGDGGVVVDGLGIHRADEANLVADSGDVGEEFGDFGAGLAVLFEGVFGACDGKGFLAGGHAGLALVGLDELAEFLTEVFLELGLVVEEVLLGRRAALEEVDHALGPGGGLESLACTGSLGAKVAIEHGGEGGDTDAGGAFAEKVPAVDEELGLGKGIVHGEV